MYSMILFIYVLTIKLCNLHFDLLRIPEKSLSFHHNPGRISKSKYKTTSAAHYVIIPAANLHRLTID